METKKISNGKRPDHRRPAAQVGVSKANNARSLLDERQQVIEDYINSLKTFMKSILRKWN